MACETGSSPDRRIGSDPALRREPVERTQSPPERILLADALALKTRDLALERRRGGLRLPDPAVERRHLRALLGETPVHRLELGQEPGLAAARVGCLGALLAKSLLRLLQIALLLADVSSSHASGQARAPPRAGRA